MSMGIGAPRRTPPAEVAGLYGLIALCTDPEAAKQRLDELQKAEEDAQAAYDKAIQAQADAEKVTKEAQIMHQRAQSAEGKAAKAAREAEADGTARSSQLKTQAEAFAKERAEFNQRVVDFNAHVATWEAQKQADSAGLDKRTRAVVSAEAAAIVKTKHAEELLADAERRIALIRSAAA
jgi:chromosome segregation ATPase